MSTPFTGNPHQKWAAHKLYWGVLPTNSDLCPVISVLRYGCLLKPVPEVLKGQRPAELSSLGWLTVEISWTKIVFMSGPQEEISFVFIYWFSDFISPPHIAGGGNLPIVKLASSYSCNTGSLDRSLYIPLKSSQHINSRRFVWSKQLPVEITLGR